MSRLVEVSVDKLPGSLDYLSDAAEGFRYLNAVWQSLRVPTQPKGYLETQDRDGTRPIRGSCHLYEINLSLAKRGYS